MKKAIRIISIVVCVLLFCSACQKQNTYKYEQELNLIDDNYRTYYEVFVYSFCDSDGDGIGDLQGVISKLDYIKELGFNGIWLMPVMPSPTYHKYDVIDYYDIDKEYGSVQDFEQLVKECNERGIKIIIDLVLNHTSTKNKWFETVTTYLKELDSSEEPSVEECPFLNYYNITKGKPDSSKYYRIGETDYYYEAVFWDQMPDLNLANKELRNEIEKIIDFWLAKGIGGFRLDAAKEFYTGETKKNIEILTWLTNYIKSKDDNNYIVAEVWDSFSTYSEYYKSGIDSVFNFAFADSDGKIVKTLNLSGGSNNAQAYAKGLVAVEERITKYNTKAIDAPFFVNHDLGRASGFLGYDERKMKIAAAMNILMSGNVFVYYGEEIGMTGSGKHENIRAPMYWSEKNREGMTNGPAAMDKQENKFESVEEQIKNKQSIYNFYKRLIRLRNENPEIGRGKVTQIDEVKDGDIAVISKTYNDETIYLLYNLSEQEEKTISLSKSKYGYESIRGYASVDGREVTIKDESIKLPPYSVVILK